MKKIKVSEATNLQLNWLVAKCEGYAEQWKYGIPNSDNRYSTDWSQGGPIMDREHIHTGPHTYGTASVICNSWYAIIGFDPDGGEHLYEADGTTRLIAAMRCYCCSKLGDVVEVPEVL